MELGIKPSYKLVVIKPKENEDIESKDNKI